MIDRFIELLHREAAAAEAVEARLRALELVVADGQQRFLGFASDDLDRASERLSALELARTMAVGAAGLPLEATAAEVSERLAAADDPEALTVALLRLRDAVRSLEDARERARLTVTVAASSARARLDAATALQAV